MNGAVHSGAVTIDPRLAERTVVVLFGGTSSEREVSLASGRAVYGALAALAAREPLAPRALAVPIGADGRWEVAGRALGPLQALAELPQDALFFLALHGGQGEGGTLQGLLAASGRLHTGSGLAASVLCLDKHLARLALADAGLTVAPARLVRRSALAGRESAWRQELASLGTLGWFVKPNTGGSSVGVRRVERPEELLAAVEEVHAGGDDALVEARVPGIEATCAVLGEETLPPVEIRPHAGRFFDYAEKYDAGGARELCPPESLDEATCRRLGEVALAAHRATGCAGYSRIDCIVPPSGVPVILEVNTLPGLTERSLLPRSAAAAGLDFTSLVLRILELALAAGSER